MSDTASLVDRFAAAMRRLFAGDEEQPPALDAVPRAAAMLLAEVARVDHDVKDIDLVAAREGLQAMFALPAGQADALLEYAGRRENRPTSYHAITSVLNRGLSAPDKIKLVEQMWHVAQVDQEIDMYEDHLVRKIADLLYVPHREFIAAKHRTRKR